MSDIMPSGSASPFDALRQIGDDGREYWSARDLCDSLGYVQWRQFEDAVERARFACTNAGHEVGYHFAGARKVIEGGRWGTQSVSDWHLTRYGAYLVAMNGDPRKPEIADAQTYFAAKTREAETRLASSVEPPDELELAERYVVAIKEKRAALARAAEAEARVVELEPSARSWDMLATGRGNYSVAGAAYLLNQDPSIETGERRLFATLKQLGWIYRSRGTKRWQPYQSSIEAERLAAKVQSYEDRDTGETVVVDPQVRVTVKGVHDLHKRLGGTGPLDQYIAEFPPDGSGPRPTQMTLMDEAS